MSNVCRGFVKFTCGTGMKDKEVGRQMIARDNAGHGSRVSQIGRQECRSLGPTSYISSFMGMGRTHEYS